MLFWWSNGCWQFDLWFLCFSKSSLNIWKFTVHVLLKPGLENFEYYFASVWDEGKCVVVWAFFGIASLWDWNENWPFPVLWPLLSFPNLLAYFTASSFSIWNSSTGIPSPLLVLFIVMFPKAYLTFHSRMSGSRWVITPFWLFGTQGSFLYSSSVCSCNVFLISSASVKSKPFLSFIVHIFVWNVSLVSLIFLKRSLVFPILLFSCFFALINEEGFLIFPCYWTQDSNEYIFPFLLCLSLLSFSQLFVRPLQTTILPFCISFFLGMVLITASCTMSQTSVRSSLGTMSIRSNSLNLFVTSNV